MGRALNLFVFMKREYAGKDDNEKIDAALRPPADWRDPMTGLPAGWEDDDDSAWAEWEQQMAR